MNKKIMLFLVVIMFTNINVIYSQLCSGNIGNYVFVENFGSGALLYGPALPSTVTTYPYLIGTPTNGSYYISYTANASNILGYVNDGDHTGDTSGYMMVINADYGSGESYRRHVTGLCPNTTYVFSAYLANNNTTSAANINCGGSYIYSNVKFQIEYPLGTVQGSANTGNLPTANTDTALVWVQNGFVFTTQSGQTYADIALINNAPGGCGNDYVVDDISLSPCGPSVSLNIIPNQTNFCIGDAISLHSNIVSGGYINPQYQWQYSINGGLTWNNLVGAISQDFNIASVTSAQSGFYRLIISENGNINSSTCSVLAGPVSFSVSSSTLSVNSTTICALQTTTLIASGSNNYLWSNGAVSSSIVVSPTVSTNYTVTGGLSGCTNQAIASVNVLALPIVNINSSSLSICKNDSTILSITGVGNYTWSPIIGLNNSIGSFIIASPSITTNYSVVGSNGVCSNSAVITVTVDNPPNISTSIINTSCGLSNGSVTVTSSPSTVTYTWSNGLQTNSIGGLLPDTYSVIVANGTCQTSTVINILASVPLQINSSTISPASCNMNDGSIVLISNLLNNTYSWSPQVSNTNTANNLTTGNYSLTISNSSCSTTTVFTVPQIKFSPGLLITTNSAICKAANGTITVTNTVTSPSSYQVNINNQGFTSALTYTNLVAGNYIVMVKDANNCIDTDTITVVENNTNLLIDTTLQMPNCNDNNGLFAINSITGGQTPYFINFNNSGFNTNTIFNNLSSGDYVLSIMDDNKCMSDFHILIPESIVESTLYIPNTFTANNDKINDFWRISATCIESMSCSIYNRWGSKIIDLKDISEGWDGMCQGKEVPDGVYVYILEAKTYSKKNINKVGHITLFR